MNGADYRAEAGALDVRIRAAIASGALAETAFDALACDVFAHQLRWNAPYAAFARSLGFGPASLPRRAVDIPAVPAAAFKEAVLCTVAAADAALWFETSGTTQARSGRHYLESPALYEAALLAGFERLFLTGGPPASAYRYALLVPDPRERPHSSLGYMMQTIVRSHAAEAAWIVHGDRLDVAALEAFVARAHAHAAPVCLATTAFALVALLDERDARGTALTLPAGSRVMETGGFKGRTRIVARDELYNRAARAFGIEPAAIVAEYGMTELSSQYYDAPASRAAPQRIKMPVPWLRPVVVDANGTPLPPGVVGAIRHIDCANRSSVVAVDTEDLGAIVAGGIVLLGREEGASLRGCSLDAEDLVRR